MTNTEATMANHSNPHILIRIETANRGIVVSRHKNRANAESALKRHARRMPTNTHTNLMWTIREAWGNRGERVRY